MNVSLVGRQIGSYQLSSLLGRGGMGEVYRAYDTKLRREVAIKVLPDALAADPDLLRRLEREARLLAALNHPHIAAIYGLEEAEGVRALVLELVEGPTLADRLATGPLEVDEALRISCQIVDALEATHEKGIVHRDLKPANIKVTGSVAGRGTVKLLDFGLAMQAVSSDAETMATRSRLTASGYIVGTVGYMSPEQVRGEEVDPRSDQFSLGAILFEMVTGQAVFERKSLGEALAAVLRDDPPPLRRLNPSVPAPLQQIVDRCLAKERDDRYRSTHDLARDLVTLRDRLLPSRLAVAPTGRPPLPVSRTPLLGRESDLAAARALLMREEVRLVTFTGTGGTGKTRLALQVAADVGPAFGGGVYFVALASINDPALVAPTIAQALGAREIGKRDPAEVVKETLSAAGEPTLLLLDNFEQVLDSAPLLTDLLEGCAHLKVLVTSQAVLRVYGEHDFEVPPLEVPSRVTRLSLAELARYPAVALFLQRATAVKPDFALAAENASAVAEICTRLDGLPLAIELAAARVRMLPPRAILQRLESRFELLTGGARDLPARQQTLRATVEWSYGLLTADEQQLFRRLAVFVNGCTLEAVEAVCNARGDLAADMLDLTESLVGKSLVQQMQPPDGETRFMMLETIRDYAGQQLASSADEAVTERAHAAYCLVLAEEGAAEITPRERAAWLERCDLECDNFRAALEWAMRTGAVEWGLRLGAAVYPFWLAREQYTEGRERLDALLKLPTAPEALRARARALHAAGDLEAIGGEEAYYVAARARYEESLAISRALGDPAGTISELNALAAVEFFQGHLNAARALFEECLRVSREAGIERAVAQALSNLAGIEAGGDLRRARDLFEQALEIFLRLRDTAGVAWLQSRLGDLERQQGDATTARAWYERALATFEGLRDRKAIARTMVDLAALAYDQGDDRTAHMVLARALTAFRDLGHRGGVARALDGFATFAAGRGQAERALHLAGAADAIRHSVGASFKIQSEKETFARELDQARQALGDGALAAEMEGWAMTMEAAIEYALNC